jgi:sRNA-binding carbon storage regulator CsrA
MLSLSRYPSESIFLFDKDENPIAEIKINSNKGSQISVGIQAPKSVGIVRSELLTPERISEIASLLR